MHRDLKPANILVNFPNCDLSECYRRDLDKEKRKELLKNRLKSMDIIKENIIIKIADLGFARELD